MNSQQLIIKILEYKAKLDVISIIIDQMPIEKAKEITKTLFDIDLDELEKLL